MGKKIKDNGIKEKTKEISEICGLCHCTEPPTVVKISVSTDSGRCPCCDEEYVYLPDTEQVVSAKFVEDVVSEMENVNPGEAFETMIGSDDDEYTNLNKLNSAGHAMHIINEKYPG
ncbi:MAG: hypothetical protein WCW02_02380 [Candidatus Buchananbacteria bacterium]